MLVKSENDKVGFVICVKDETEISIMSSKLKNQMLHTIFMVAVMVIGKNRTLSDFNKATKKFRRTHVSRLYHIWIF